MPLITLLLLSTCIVFCWSGKPLDYTPLLKYLDDDIVRDLTDPVKHRGEILLGYVERFNEGLVDTRDMIQQNIYEAYIKALELQKIGGPQFLKVTPDKDRLKTMYTWTDEDLDNLQNHFKQTEQLWREVLEEFEPAAARFKQIHDEDAKEKAQMAEREEKRVEELRKAEEEFNKRVTVNIGTTKPIL